jgi:hypothetical protein
MACGRDLAIGEMLNNKRRSSECGRPLATTSEPRFLAGGGTSGMLASTMQ